MPLDTSSYSLALLRLDGRRWNELRRLTAQVSTQAAADGSSYFEMGNTRVICTVTGPTEPKASGGARNGDKAIVAVEINIAGFSAVERKKRARNDRRVSEMQTTIQNTFSETIFTNLYPRSTITLSLQVLSQDGSLLAACLNASTLALIDAGIPMQDYVCSCTAGSTSSYSSNDEQADPLLDLNSMEEQELPFLTVATLGQSDTVCTLVMETKIQIGRLEGMLAVGVDGCKQVKEVLDSVIKTRGARVLEAAKV